MDINLTVAKAVEVANLEVLKNNIICLANEMNCSFEELKLDNNNDDFVMFTISNPHHNVNVKVFFDFYSRRCYVGEVRVYGHLVFDLDNVFADLDSDLKPEYIITSVEDVKRLLALNAK